MKMESKWTRFMDMRSGGGQKLKWEYIYIEAPEKEAKIIFQNKFKRNPERITCTHCGSDYSISEEDTLEEASAFERHCRSAYFDKEGNEVPDDVAFIRGKGIVNGYTWRYVEEEDKEKIEDMTKKYPDSNWKKYYKFILLKEYKKKKEVLVITKNMIKPKWRKGKLKKEGYVWVN